MQVARGERAAEGKGWEGEEEEEEGVAHAVGKFADKFISVAALPDEPSIHQGQDATPRSHSGRAVNRDRSRPDLKRQRETSPGA